MSKVHVNKGFMLMLISSLWAVAVGLPSAASATQEDASNTCDGTVAEHWAQKDGEEDEDEIEVVVDGHPLWAPPLEVLEDGASSGHGCLCERTVQDDHGGTFPCATVIDLQQVVGGRLDAAGGGRSGDRDLFLVAVPGREGDTTLMSWSWSADVAAGLRVLDGAGRPLVVFRGGGVDVEHRRLRLPSGLYYLEIDAVASRPGSYAMVVDVLR